MRIVSEKDIWGTDLNPYFNVKYENGQYSSSNRESYYTKLLPDETFSYDVSNNKVLANIDEFGTIKKVTFYRDSYIADDIPGVWVEKDFSQEGPFSFRLEMDDGSAYDLKRGIGKTVSDLLDNLFPRIQMGTSSFKVLLTVFAPVSGDGSRRLSTLVYSISIVNIGSCRLGGQIILPSMTPDTHNYFTLINASGEEEKSGEGEGKVPFNIQPGEMFWTSYIIYAPGYHDDVDQIKKLGSIYWLTQTQEYFRNILGRLSFQNDPMTGFLFERALYQSISAIGMSQDNEICGSNWGTFPATKQIWMKDMYYSFLPAAIIDSKFFLQGSLWFLKYGIRPKGSRYSGGVYHSVSNSLSSVIMGCMYYEYTGDAEFFRTHPFVYQSYVRILCEIENLKTDECWLIPSLWISDALSLGKYHTGTNVCVWKAFSGCARIAKEVMDDPEHAEEYSDFAERVKQDIKKYMTIKGPYGIQYLEGIGGLTPETKQFLPLEYYKKKYVDQALTFLPDVIKGDKINLLMHDGEESDTTLIPFYGFTSYDDKVLRNYLKFSMSTYNPTYGTECRGIKWGNESGATFPGYSTGFSAIVDNETMNGEHGYLRELKRLADLDGSWWWWPYRCGTKNGDVNRLNNCGKCGWASGIVATTMITQILGLTFDGPTKTLRFRPFSPAGSFTWEHARIGIAKLNVSYQKDKDTKRIVLTSLMDFAINVELEVVSEHVPKQAFETGMFLDQRTVKIRSVINPRGEFSIEI